MLLSIKKYFKLKTRIVILLSAFVSILSGLTYAEDKYDTFPAQFNLTSLNGKNGFTINGIYPKDFSGYSVSGAGDINGDGIADILIGAPNATHGTGRSYIIFGGKAWPPYVNLDDLNGNNGFTINGGNPNDLVGFSVSGAGDVNGDGIDDVLIGAPYLSTFNGSSQSYIIFGSKKPWLAVINLDNLNGNNGFAINGGNPNDVVGFSVSGAGDVNEDGIADILIGAFKANGKRGQSYVVFGSKKAWPIAINLDDLNGKNGFIIMNINSNDSEAVSVSGAGDVNGDGITDILIGAPTANNDAGQSYAVFGRKDSWPAVINLDDLNGNNGFVINGINPNDGSGFSVSGVGDVNEDGIADILIGAPTANNFTGQSYVIFGSKEGWPAAMSLSALNGKNGFAINGVNVGDYSAWSVSGAGDVNRDGIADILIGAPGANNFTGQSYIVFGHKDPWPAVIYLDDLSGGNGFAINGINPNDGSGTSVSRAGDVNGDGIADILIGAFLFNDKKGQSYVVFGCCGKEP